MLVFCIEWHVTRTQPASVATHLLRNRSSCIRATAFPLPSLCASLCLQWCRAPQLDGAHGKWLCVDIVMQPWHLACHGASKAFEGLLRCPGEAVLRHVLAGHQAQAAMSSGSVIDAACGLDHHQLCRLLQARTNTTIRRFLMLHCQSCACSATSGTVAVGRICATHWQSTKPGSTRRQRQQHLPL